MAQAHANAQDKELEFLHYWTIKMSDLLDKSPQYPKTVLSPEIRTRHGDFLFDWRIGRNIYDNTFWLYPILTAATNNCKFIRCLWFISLERSDTLLTATFPKSVQADYNCRGFSNREIEEKAVNGMVTFRFHLKIAETEFIRSGMNISEVEKVVAEIGEQVEICWTCGRGKDVQYSPLSNLFDKILVLKKGEDLKNPDDGEADIHQKLLDFQIETSDLDVIWCHKATLAAENKCFAASIGSGDQEKGNSSVKVKFGTDMMMEVLHFIYRGFASSAEWFQRPKLEEILDAATEYDLANMKTAIAMQLYQQCDLLDGETALHVLDLADKYGMPGVKRKALAWASKNVSKILGCDARKELKEHLLLEIAKASDAR